MSKKNSSCTQQATYHYATFKEQFSLHLAQYDPHIQESIFQIVSKTLFEEAGTHSLDTIIAHATLLLKQKGLIVFNLPEIVLEIINFFGKLTNVENQTPHIFKQELKQLLWPKLNNTKQHALGNAQKIDQIADKIISCFTTQEYLCTREITNNLCRQSLFKKISKTTIEWCVENFFDLLSERGLIQIEG